MEEFTAGHVPGAVNIPYMLRIGSGLLLFHPVISGNICFVAVFKLSFLILTLFISKENLLNLCKFIILLFLYLWRLMQE